MSKWTQFMDMHSGGGQKLDWAYIYIEAPADEARVIFYNRFGRNPSRVTCTCCGEDYSVTESESLADATAYERNLRCAEDARGWLYGANRPSDYKDGRYLEPGEDVPDGMVVRNHYAGDDEYPEGIPLDDFIRAGRADAGGAPLARGSVLFVRADDIKPEERVGTVPEEGYVWAGDD